MQFTVLHCNLPFPQCTAIVLCVELLNILICSPPKLGHALFWVHWTHVHVQCRFSKMISPRLCLLHTVSPSFVCVFLGVLVCVIYVGGQMCMFVYVCVVLFDVFVVLWVCVVCTIECSQLLPSLPFKCQSDPPQSPHLDELIIIIIIVLVVKSLIVVIIMSIFTTETNCSCQGPEVLLSKYAVGLKGGAPRNWACCRCSIAQPRILNFFLLSPDANQGFSFLWQFPEITPSETDVAAYCYKWMDWMDGNLQVYRVA